MKKIIAASMILFSSVAFGESETVMKCQMNIMRISSGKMIGDPHQLAPLTLCVKTPLVLFMMTSDMCLMNVKRLRNEQHR